MLLRRPLVNPTVGVVTLSRHGWDCDDTEYPADEGDRRRQVGLTSAWVIEGVAAIGRNKRALYFTAASLPDRAAHACTAYT